ncbi:hypothetical protein ACFLS9_06810 [Bacteroidota bacterium]
MYRLSGGCIKTSNKPFTTGIPAGKTGNSFPALAQNPTLEPALTDCRAGVLVNDFYTAFFVIGDN